MLDKDWWKIDLEVSYSFALVEHEIDNTYILYWCLPTDSMEVLYKYIEAEYTSLLQQWAHTSLSAAHSFVPFANLIPIV
jgi:hypothetical protein